MTEQTPRDGTAPGGPGADTGPASGKRDEESTIQATMAPPEAHTAPEVTFAPPTAADLYKERLRGIWEATHGGLNPPGANSPNAGAWELVQDAVINGGNLALIGAAVVQHRSSAGAGGGAADPGLSGDPRTVEILVGSAIQQLPPEQIPAFISGPLARTCERLEREVGRGDVTREQIVDIVVRAMEPLRGTEVAGRMVPPLLGFLNGENRAPTVGIYTTVAVLAQLMIGLDDRRSRLVRIFLYHYALLGVWRLLHEDPGLAFDAPVRQVVSVAAGNAGMNLWQVLPDRVAEARGTPEVLALRVILMITVRELGVAEPDAAAILEALGMANPHARAMLTVINEAGALASPWSADWTDVAWLESAAAVAAVAAAASPDQAAARLYNASVSLQGLPDAAAPGPLRARMLLNALGLYWSLLLGTGLRDAMDRLEGVDCASGFMYAAGQYQDEGHDQTRFWPAVTGLAALLTDLPRRLPQDRPVLATKVARLAEAAGRVRLPAGTIPREPEYANLVTATIGVIDALRSSGAIPETESLTAHLLDTATVIRGVYEEILDRQDWGLRETVEDLTSRRGNPREEFLSSYAPYSEPADSFLGTGPPVTAGAASEEEWNQIAAVLLRDPGSIVPVLLREFPR